MTGEFLLSDWLLFDSVQPLWSPSGLPDQSISLYNKNSWLSRHFSFTSLPFFCSSLLAYYIAVLNPRFLSLYYPYFYLNRFLSNIVCSIPIIVFLTDHCSKTRLSVDGFPLTFLFLFLSSLSTPSILSCHMITKLLHLSIQTLSFATMRLGRFQFVENVALEFMAMP